MSFQELETILRTRVQWPLSALLIMPFLSDSAILIIW